MGSESTSIKLNAEAQLLLEQPLLRLPHELLRRNFKTAQRHVERDRDAVMSSLKDTANASMAGNENTETTLQNLDNMISRMNGLKRKLESLHVEEASLHEKTRKRIAHLNELYKIPNLVDPKFQEWSGVRLNRLLVDLLIRNGYEESAKALASEKRIDDLVDTEVFLQSHRIQESLRSGSTTECLAWCQENKQTLKKTKSPLEFELRLQQYIELVRQNTKEKFLEAQAHARKHLIPHAQDQMPALLTAFALPAYPASGAIDGYSYRKRTHHTRLSSSYMSNMHTGYTNPNGTGPVKDPVPQQGNQLIRVSNLSGDPDPQRLYSHARWNELAELFVKTHNSLFSLPARPLLHIALSAGLSALKTPTCNMKHTEEHMTDPSKMAATAPSVCPICSTELKYLAQNLPYAHHTKSHVDPDPLVLPNGRVYGKDRLLALGAKVGVPPGKVRDPVTGHLFEEAHLKKIFIS